MLEDYKEGLKEWGDTIRVAPIRTIAGWLFLLPALCVTFYILTIFIGAILDILLTFIFYGLSGLSRNEMGEIYFFFVKISAFFLRVIFLMIPFGGIVFKFLIMIIYSFMGSILLGSAIKDHARKRLQNPQE